MCGDVHWMKRVKEAGLRSPGKQGMFWNLAVLAVHCRAPGHRWGKVGGGQAAQMIAGGSRKNMSNQESISPRACFNFHALRRNNPTTFRSTRWRRAGSERHRSRGNWLFSSTVVFTACFQCEEAHCCMTALECEDKLYVLYKRSKKIFMMKQT